MSKAPVSYKYIQGLLDVAEFLVTNPELPEPSSMDNSFITFNYWGKDPAEIQRLARLIPGTMTKNDPKKDSYNGAYYILTSAQISPGKDTNCQCTNAAFTVGVEPVGFAVMCQLASTPSAHSVMAFILMVCACSSVSRAGSNASHGTSLSMFQRTASNCLKSSG